MKKRLRKPRHVERPDARRYFDIGYASSVDGHSRRFADRDGPHEALGRRALRALHGVDRANRPADYVVSDVFVDSSGRHPSVVYLQQRHNGLAVYDGRRSVVFDRRGAKVTGRRVDVRGSFHWTTRRTAEEALRRAARRVLRAAPTDPITLVSSFASRDEFHSFEWGKSILKPTAHLVLFVRDEARLAWVVEFALEEGPAFEIVLDAGSLRLLKRRVTSHDLSADIFISPQARVTMTFDPSWGPPAWDRLRCFYDDSEAILPAVANGAMSPTTRPERRSLNVIALISEGLSLLEGAGARLLTFSGSRPEARVYYGTYDSTEDAAGAFAEFVRFRGFRKGSTFKHAAEDPTVVLHEVSHIVLSNNVGGKKFAAPFENIGESGAVSEALADFCGLTLFNHIARSAMPPFGEGWAMGAWFLPTPRNYSPFRASPPPAAYPSGSGIHLGGMALCGALIAGHFALEQATGFADEADRILWNALFAGLRASPHEGPLPTFCCVTTRLLAALDTTSRGLVQPAFASVGVPLVCPHIN